MKQYINISICICTYNRYKQLTQTLESLLANQQELIEGDEILIVDNNSNDQTRSLIAQYQDRLPLEYYFESTQGLSAARNKGLEEFKNDLIVFIDDDITITTNYINEYRKALSQYSDKGFFGGKIHIDWQGKKPNWYRSTQMPLLNGLFVYYDQGDVDVDFTEQSLLPYGANFALTRSTIDKVGGFDLGLGVKGEVIARGEETDYFRRAQSIGLKGIYLAQAKVFHRYQPERFSLTYLYQYGIQKGLAAVNLDGAQEQSLYLKISYQFFSGIYQLLKFRRDRFYQCVINIGLFRGIQNASKHMHETLAAERKS